MIQVNYISKFYPPVWPKSCEKHKFLPLLLPDINAYFFNKGIQRLFSVKYLLIRKKEIIPRILYYLKTTELSW